MNIFKLLTFFSKDHDKAVVENEFKYKNCCIDGQGNFFLLLFVFAIICEGLSSLNSKKIDPKTCSESICHSSDYLLYATWISSMVDKEYVYRPYKL